MMPPIETLRARLAEMIADKREQGHEVEDVELPRTYDELAALAERIERAPLREDWPYVEPDDLDAIRRACDASREIGVAGTVAPDQAAARSSAAFLGSVCGCILGKPFEIDPTMDELRAALEPSGEWPLRDYASEAAVKRLRTTQPQWVETVRERIRHVAPDDDINYTILGMLLLERHGIDFTQAQLRDLWMLQLPLGATFGPERTMLLRSGIDSLGAARAGDLGAWAASWNPGAELCGALIRGDAYGYACPGRPELAAGLAFRDASFTHRRTGVYGAMYVAAAIAIAPVARDPLDIFERALGYVPQRSRFAEVVRDSLEIVRATSGFEEAYRTLAASYGRYTHCRIYFEIGTLANTLRFAESVGDGICKQVMQGNDTDSFGATAGSILGAYFGPGHLDDRWVAPFNDDLHTALATFYERSLSAVASRMGRLPGRVQA